MTSLPGMERWAGKTAVVTGAGSGIGAGVAAALAAAGMRVVAVDRKEEAAITEASKRSKKAAETSWGHRTSCQFLSSSSCQPKNGNRVDVVLPQGSS
ncbi:hypothetical protein MSG28_005871 [Choristoneura fumiferana]|uniref:Uncharacterized protein n=1 Tax=Choristoneura fumiferana TaxID=7141 RepID=A0ACC0L1F1_CHOFU|nr:hypothetical protein MSG28_005871 [Choristoneura fumiferana]